MAADATKVSRAQDVAWLVALGLFAALLLTHLGHYSLWDDEANTAIFASNLWTFHDLVAWDGTNIIAYRDGLELTGIKNRVYPPFQYVWAAPWLGLLGRNAWAARLPFALAAFAGFAFWAYWLRRARAKWNVQLLTFLALLGNVSLFLYSRQSRYYALAWALSVVMVFLYVHRGESRRFRVLFALTGMLLLATHYLSYGATMICLALDYLLFELGRKRDSWAQRFIFLGSQIIFCAGLLFFFNPIGRKVTEYVPVSWWADKLKLFWWNIRDLNACEFFWPPFIVLALLVFFAGRLKDLWLLRAVMALGVYAFVASILSVQPVGWASVSDIRYMAAAIPLCIFIAVRSLSSLDFIAARIIGVLLGGFVFLTTYPHAWFQRVSKSANPIEYRSTLLSFIGELRDPPRQAFKEAAQWLNAHAAPGSTVTVRPSFGLYPLMFHAPKLVYMWQFDPSRRAEYPMLNEAHFRFLSVPDYIVSFGPEVSWSRSAQAQMAQQNIRYEPEVRLDVFGIDKTRPELFWRSFTTTPIRDPQYEATYISKRASP